MDNIKMYPCERNLYYKGKVISVSKFETEQKYVNDKRRIINRFGNGYGVLCGMEMVMLSQDELCVEAGISLDSMGREIIIPTPDVRKLYRIKGYDPNKNNAEYFMYVKYDEQKADRINNLAEVGNEATFDKVIEGYHLFLSEKEPDYEEVYIDDYYRKEYPVYEDENISIVASMPRYVKGGDKIILKVKIFRKQEDLPLRFEAFATLSGCRYEENDSMKIQFDTKVSNSREYELIYLLDSLNVHDDLAEITMLKSDCSLYINEEFKEIEEDVFLESILTPSDITEYVISDYQHNLLRVASTPSQDDVCLGKVIIKDGIITKVEKIDRMMYLNTPDKLYLENLILKDKLSILQKENHESVNGGISSKVSSGINGEITSGEVVIPLGIGGKVGKRFFSEEISHGLGIGNVSINLGFKNVNEKDETVVYGSSEVFDEEVVGAPAELAAKVNVEKGTFVIGARLLKSTLEYEIVVCWSATKHKEKYHNDEERKIVMTNSMKTLHIMDSIYLSVKFVNMPETNVVWSVDGENSGTVNESGCYTAPGKPGVYKVIAQCAKEPEIFASAYIVVKP